MGYGQSQEKKAKKRELTPEQQKAQEEALIKWVSEQIAIDKQTLMAKFPFTGNVISRLDVLVGHWDDVHTACTDGNKIWIDVLFYVKLDPEERLFILAHECWHVILRHFLRKMNRNQELWNWATDLEIHFLLTKEGLKAPFVLPHKPEWKDLSFEEIYDRLLDQAKKDQSLGNGEKPDSKDGENGSGSGKTIVISENELGKGDKPEDFQGQDENQNYDGSSAVGDIPKDWNQGKESKNLKGAKNGKGFDSHNKKEDSESKDNDPKEIEDRIVGKIKAASDFVRKRNRGILPAYLQGLIDDLPKNEIPWQQVLRQFVTQTIGGNRQWLPPNRRHSEVTFREVLFCFVIAAVLFSIGFWGSGAIQHRVNQRLLRYRQAAQIENNDEAFSLALKTDVGNAFVEGKFDAIDPVIHRNLDGTWTRWEASYQEYRRHTRVVTYTVSNGKGGTSTRTRTEHYWSWDTIKVEEDSVKNVIFCGEKIPFRKFDPTYSCFISKTVDTGYHLRVVFNLIPSSFHAACYSTLKDGTISDKTPIYRNRTVQELYKDYTTSYAVRIFWGIWIVIIIVALVVFVLHDNDWLE